MTIFTRSVPLITRFSNERINIKSVLFIVILLLFFWFSPPPTGLSIKSWHLFSIFICTILSIIAKPLPMGAIAIIAISICILTNTLTTTQALSSFNSSTVWLIALAFLLARGFIKTGLGSRIAYYFVYILGKSTLGLSYGIMLTELVLSPLVPSNTARGGGIIYPLVTSLSKEFHSDPNNNTQRRIGGFLITVCYHTNLITSAMFITAMAANPLMISFAKTWGVDITWLNWAKATIVPGMISLITLPIIIYFIYPPQIKTTPKAKQIALEKLKSMGSISIHEILMLFTFGMLLLLWMFGEDFGFDATGAAFIGLSILLIGGVLTWQDILNEKNTWDTFIWLSTLLMMTNFLTQYGMVEWFSNHMHKIVINRTWPTAMAILLVIFFYTHYFFASLTAHITSLYSAFVTVSISSGAPPMLSCLIFAFIATLSACTTHYGTGTGPVYFGTGYVTFAHWWIIGAIMGFVHILIWCGVGLLWWKYLGIW